MLQRVTKNYKIEQKLTPIKTACYIKLQLLSHFPAE